MPDETLSLQTVEARVAARRRPAPAIRHRPRHTPLGRSVQLAHVRHTDGVEVEEVVRFTNEEVDDFVRAAEAIAHTGWHGVGLGPDDLVAQDPAVLDQRQGNPLGSQDETLLGGTLRVSATCLLYTSPSPR